MYSSAEILQVKEESSFSISIATTVHLNVDLNQVVHVVVQGLYPKCYKLQTLNPKP